MARSSRSSSRRRRTDHRHRSPERVHLASSLSPLTDVVFLLLIFFALTLNFLVPEFDLRADLPEGGVQELPVELDDRMVLIELDWREGDGGGRCIARTMERGGGTDSSRQLHTFGTRLPGEEPVHPTSARVDYPAPDFFEITDHLRSRQASCRRSGSDLRVELRFDDGVPVQMIASVIDICTGLGIEDVRFPVEIESMPSRPARRAGRLRGPAGREAES